MSALSDYLENKLLDHLLRNTAYSKPATLYFALFTADPGESGVSGEVSGGSYARVAVTNDNVRFPQCAGSGTPTKANATIISFPTATAAWGTATHWAIYDASSGGTNMLAHGALATTRSIVSGDSPRLAVGEVSFTMNNAVAGGLTDFAKRKLLDHVFGGPSYTPPVTIYTGLGTDLTAGVITEYTDPNYARQATAFDAAVAGESLNTAVEAYCAAGVASVTATLTCFGVWDGPPSGNLLAAGDLGTSITVAVTDTVSLPIGSLSISLQ